MAMRHNWSHARLRRCDRRKDTGQYHGKHQRTVHGQQQIRGGVHVDAAAISARTHDRRCVLVTYLFIPLVLADWWVNTFSSIDLRWNTNCRRFSIRDRFVSKRVSLWKSTAWNTLPDHVQQTTNITTFKRHLKTSFSTSVSGLFVVSLAFKFTSVFNYLYFSIVQHCMVIYVSVSFYVLRYLIGLRLRHTVSLIVNVIVVRLYICVVFCKKRNEMSWNS